MPEKLITYGKPGIITKGNILEYILECRKILDELEKEKSISINNPYPADYDGLYY